MMRVGHLLSWERALHLPLRVSAPMYRALDSAPWNAPRESGPLPGSTPSVAGIVFSKDRPLQLDALLRTFRTLASGDVSLTVIYAASTERYRDAYLELMGLHESGATRFLAESEHGGFRASLGDVLDKLTSDAVFFLVDDIVFIERVDIERLARLAVEGFVPSMRLGRNVTYSYVVTRRQKLPPMKPLARSGPASAAGGDEELWAWKWRSGELDWAYPLSLDGNVFVAKEIRECIQSLDFSAPNTLEDALQSANQRFRHRWGVCYRKSRLVNLPINRVQDEVLNLHGLVHQDDLLAMWNRGLRLDTSTLLGFNNVSVHEEAPLTFVPVTE